MSTHVALVRSATGLDLAAARLDALGGIPAAASDHELRNLYLLAREITTSSLHREESRGAHYRLDHPDLNSSLDGCHLVVQSHADGADRHYGRLGNALTASGGSPSTGLRN